MDIPQLILGATQDKKKKNMKKHKWNKHHYKYQDYFWWWWVSVKSSWQMILVADADSEECDWHFKVFQSWNKDTTK